MASFNKVIVMGNLTRDPELRHTPKGSAVCDFAIAVNETYRTGDGNLKEEVCYVEIVVWGRVAETCREYLGKGSLVLIEGRLQLDQWEADGQKKSRMRVRADMVKFLGKPRAGGASPGTSSNRSYQGGQGGQRPDDAYPNEEHERAHRATASATSGHAETPEDDIPF